MATRRKPRPAPTIELQYQLPPEDQPLVDLLVTEDDEPVDNPFSEKQRRLLVGPLYSSWRGGAGKRPFMASSDVGLFHAVRQPPLVPDAFLSLDVNISPDIWRNGRAYFFWVYGKPPEVVVEVVSNTKGGEVNRKIPLYAQMGVRYYAILDPMGRLRRGRLRMFVLTPDGYLPTTNLWMPEVGLGFTLWHGLYEDLEETWLRWCDADGQVYPTSEELAQGYAERAEQERERAEQERERAEQERERAEQERERAERLAERLRALGIDPDNA